MGRCAALVLGMILASLILFVQGCNDPSNNVDRTIIVKTDCDELQRLIHLPAGVKHCEWQTGNLSPHGGDWWLAAVLEVENISDFIQGAGTKDVFETPPGLELISSFAILKSIPEAQSIEHNALRLITETYSIVPYANSPLLNGKVIRLSGNQVLVVLWTN